MAKNQALSLEEKLEQALVKSEEQPYEISANWCWIKMDSLIELISGRDLPISDCNDEKKGIPYILGASNIANGDFFVNRWTQKPSVLGLQGDVLLSVKGTVGKIALLNEEKIHLSRQIMSLRAKKSIYNLFLMHFLNTYIGKLNEVSRGLIPGVSRVDILSIAVPLPPISEQYRLVEKIESLFSKLDRAKELAQTALDSFASRKAAILHQAFSGELTRKWREENGVFDVDKEIDEQESFNIKIPDSWEWTEVSKIGKVKGGKRLPKGEKLVKFDTGFPYIKAGDLKNGTVLYNNVEYITEEIRSKIKNYTVKENDVYITIVGACIGDVGVVPAEMDGANLTENAAKITDLKCDSKYLALALSSNLLQAQIKNSIASATLGKLSLQNINKITVPLPGTREQQEIVRILDHLLENEQTASELCDVIERIEQLKKAILARAFRGELGTNDPAEESALELLKTVLQERD
ncbi:restriction endonuclease subunit S [Azotosporobacter soli]|uniref:restriction endonuclease subunit S n=1 Tax=Azotosporobacter soli TaxID=3055040 RepID=UPI0031FE733B